MKIFEGVAIKDKEIYLRLVCSGSGEVSLIACDVYGNMVENGYILRINPDGSLFYYFDINSTIGLKLDKLGRIVERGR